VPVTQGGEIYLIDGSSYIYRAFYAMRNLSTSKGMPTNAVFICSRMILTLLKEKQPERICFVLDSRGPTFRHELYSGYKATRQRMPEDLGVQIPYILQVVEALGIPIVQKEGLEADDIIAALAARCRGECTVYVVSGDKDLMQLVDETTLVWDTLAGKVYDREAVRDKYGVYPEYIPDLLAVMGDSSDNIPGVPGIGAKGAAALVSEMGHVRDMLDNLDAISSPRQRKALEESGDKALEGLELVRLDREIDLDFGPGDLRAGPPDVKRLREIFTELEFKALISELNLAADQERAPVCEGSVEYACRDDYTGEMGMYLMPGVGSAISQDGRCTVCLDADACLKPLENPGASLCMHDAKQAFVAALMKGMEVKASVFDTMLAAYCIDAVNSQVSLEDLARAHLDRDLPGKAELLGTGRNTLSISAVERETLGRYLAGHAEVLLPIRERLAKRMAEVGVEKIFHEIEIPLTTVLSRLEACGVLVDTQGLGRISREIDGLIGDMESRIFALAGESFNINSPKQLGVILFEKLGLPAARKTKTGYSTDSRVLESLASKHDLPALILQYRMFAKLKNTYVDALPSMINPATGRIHTRFNQALTATGRISSSEPNLQNIPVRSEMGRRIRQAFIAPEGFKLLSADYSQIELRILAHITGDATLTDSFAQGLDIHAKTASEIFGIPLSEVQDSHRRTAKTINFGIMYGMGPHKLSQELGIRRDRAKDYIESYLAKYPGVRRYTEETAARAERDGFVTTLLGRRRSIPEIRSSNFNEREAGRRIAINTPIQGSAADIIKIAMVRIFDLLQGFRSRMVLQVHDELVFEAAEDEIEQLSAMVRQEMEHAFELNVPVKVEIGTGENWADAH
jgi:DNA polymerase-1